MLRGRVVWAMASDEDPKVTPSVTNIAVPNRMETDH